MTYKQYIQLGFIRSEMSDTVEYDQTGYFGYCLTKHINDKMLVEVTSAELDKPKLYIAKSADTYHIVPITTEMVKDIFFEIKSFA